MTLPVPPAQAAAPGQQPDPNQPPTNPPAPPEAPGGKVTITNEEYADLQRQKARLAALQRSGNRPRAAKPVTVDPTADPDAAVAEEVQRERERSAALQQQIFDRDVRDHARDLLAKPEYAKLPESTKRLILRNPASYIQSQDLESAKMDLEDFLREEVAAVPPSTTPPGQPAAPAPRPANEPPGHETPPHVGAGSPAAPPSDQLEDLSKLSGPARSQAAFRNAVKKKNGIGA